MLIMWCQMLFFEPLILVFESFLKIMTMVRRFELNVPCVFSAFALLFLHNRTSFADVIPEFMTTTALLGGNVRLPCDIRPLHDNDTTEMVLWYKDDMETPIFRVDRKNPNSGRYIRPDFKNRLSFTSDLNQQRIQSIAHLTVLNVLSKDAGVYRCRVDYELERTRNTKIYLSIIIPPKKPIIYDKLGIKLGRVAGPYKEGDELIVSCTTKGGIPPPKLVWIWGNKTVDADYQVDKSGVITNTYIISKLSRMHHNTLLICQAYNNDISIKKTSIRLKLFLRPLNVEITSGNGELSSGKHARFVCMSSGSEPPAVITWKKGNLLMPGIQDGVSSDNLTSVSILSFVATEQDDGKYLSCLARNPRISHSDVENGRKIVVYYKPIVKLEASAEVVKEGDTVLFECHSRANPPTLKGSIKWYVNGSLLQQNLTRVVIRESSMELKDVTRHQSGVYKCKSHNNEGITFSNAINIRVKYAPVCKWKDVRRIGSIPNITLKVLCELNSYTSDISFVWSLNSSEWKKTTNLMNYTQEGKTSKLFLTLKPNFSGYLYCSGSNDVGTQLEPCKYEIFKTESPKNVQNCSILEENHDSIHIKCIKGFDGGLPQEFQMEVYYQTDLVRNISALAKPEFRIDNLMPDKTYMLMIYAYNRRGKSQASGLFAKTNRAREEKVIFGPTVAILFGIIGSLLIIAAAIVMCLRLRARNESKRRNENSAMTDCRQYSKYTEMEAQNPDVVPSDGLEAVVSTCLQSMIVVEPYRGLATMGNGNRPEKCLPIEKTRNIMDVSHGELPLSTSCLDVRFIRDQSNAAMLEEDCTGDPGDLRSKSGVFHLPSESENECEDETRTPLFSRKRESSV